MVLVFTARVRKRTSTSRGRSRPILPPCPGTNCPFATGSSHRAFSPAGLQLESRDVEVLRISTRWTGTLAPPSDPPEGSEIANKVLLLTRNSADFESKSNLWPKMQIAGGGHQTLSKKDQGRAEANLGVSADVGVRDRRDRAGRRKLDAIGGFQTREGDRWLRKLTNACRGHRRKPARLVPWEVPIAEIHAPTRYRLRSCLVRIGVGIGKTLAGDELLQHHPFQEIRPGHLRGAVVGHPQRAPIISGQEESTVPWLLLRPVQ